MKKQNIERINQWQAENVERIVIKPRVDDCITSRIDALIEKGICKSRQAFIVSAIKKQLELYEKTED